MPDAARELGHGGGVARREGAHHLLGCLHLAARGRLERAVADPVPHGEVLVGKLVPAHRARRDEPPTRREQRVTGEVGPDVGPGPVGGLEIRARVAQEANGPQMENGRVTVLTDPLGELLRRGEHGGGIVPVHALDGQLGPTMQRLLDPALRRRHADPVPVVLTDEQKW